MIYSCRSFNMYTEYYRNDSIFIPQLHMYFWSDNKKTLEKVAILYNLTNYLEHINEH